jgi:hypothetical protein
LEFSQSKNKRLATRKIQTHLFTGYVDNTAEEFGLSVTEEEFFSSKLVTLEDIGVESNEVLSLTVGACVEDILGACVGSISLLMTVGPFVV